MVCWLIHSKFLDWSQIPPGNWQFPLDSIGKSLVFFLPYSAFGPYLGHITEKVCVIDECFAHDYKRFKYLWERAETQLNADGDNLFNFELM